jgi:hypothetical protein
MKLPNTVSVNVFHISLSSIKEVNYLKWKEGKMGSPLWWEDSHKPLLTSFSNGENQLYPKYWVIYLKGNLFEDCTTGLDSLFLSLWSFILKYLQYHICCKYGCQFTLAKNFHFVYFLWCENHTQSLAHAKQGLHHWATSSAQQSTFITSQPIKFCKWVLGRKIIDYYSELQNWGHIYN